MVKDGRDDEALALLQSGVGLQAHDEVALLEIAIIHLKRRDRGSRVTVTRTRQIFRGDPNWTESDEQAWKVAQLAAADDALQRAAALAPNDAGVQYHLGAVRFERKDYAAAIAYYRRAAELAPELVDPRRALATALAWAGQREAALQAMTEASKLEPLNAEILNARAELTRQLGRPAEAGVLKERAELYEFLGPFADAADGSEMMQSMRALKGKDEEEAELKRLMQREDVAALRVLAAMLWRRQCYGDNASISAALARAGKAGVELLYKVADETTSMCTMDGVIQALVDLRDPAVFDLLAQLLPQDVGFTESMNIAPAMARLGDARAAPLLIDFVHYRPPVDPDDTFPAFLLHLAQFRAVMALGSFDLPDVRTELQAQLDDAELGGAAAAAMFMLTHNSALVPRIAKVLDGEPVEAQYVAGPLKDANERAHNPELKRVLERYERKQEAVRRQEERERQRYSNTSH
jgi:tetratricopeptide (TPR) repeat protein